MSLTCIPGVQVVYNLPPLLGGGVPENITFEVTDIALPAEVVLGTQTTFDKAGGGVLASRRSILFEVGRTSGAKTQTATLGGPDPALRTTLDFASREVVTPGWTIGDNPYGHFWSLFMPSVEVFWQATGHVRAGDYDFALITEESGGTYPDLVLQAEHGLCFAVSGRGVGVRIEAGARSTVTSDFEFVLNEMAITTRAPATVQNVLDVSAAGLRIPEVASAPSAAGIAGELRFCIIAGVATLYVYTGSAWKRTAPFA